MHELANASIRLTAAEWARVGALDPKSGSYTLDFAMALNTREVDPIGPRITHDEYVAVQRTDSTGAPSEHQKETEA